MTVAEPGTLDLALWRARAAAFPNGEFVGQESFVGASEVLALARRAGVTPGVRVLDLCCGVAGPGLHIVRALGCDYLGVDSSPRAIAQARLRGAAHGLDARFEVATVPPLPAGPFDVILLLETFLAFRDKAALLQEIASALPVSGRFAFTVEEGSPLTETEREAMPGSDTVWPTPLSELFSHVEGAGMLVPWYGECTAAHLATVEALLGSYTATADEIAAASGQDTVDDLLASHRLWSTWLQTGRIRKFGIVAEKVDSPVSRESGRPLKVWPCAVRRGVADRVDLGHSG